ncbi:MAG TPA: YceI family protein [Thermoanaerobaculia bacterium]|jgi:polyisoprenoid-binding protein YceI|nr:YceI family protein [Thermoanaerobaculia bacterium]
MKLIRAFLVLAVAVPLLAQTPAAPEVWVIDKPHSSASFKIRHLMSNVTGYFNDFDAVVTIDRANPAKSSVEFTIRTQSIDTRAADRDEHLRSPDFFEVMKYPTIVFKSASVEPKSATQFEVSGDLTMHGVTKRITLPVTFLGFQRDPRGNEKAGFEIATTLDRKDYNITWNRVLDEGGLLLGDEVKIAIELEVGRKVEATAAK